MSLVTSAATKEYVFKRSINPGLESVSSIGCQLGCPRRHWLENHRSNISALNDGQLDAGPGSGIITAGKPSADGWLCQSRRG